MIRYIAGLLIMFCTSSALADPTILLLLLRFARDKAVTASLEAGVNNMRQQYSTTPSPSYGFALPTPAIPRGNEDQQLRTLIDENFLHLTSSQRDAVYVDMRRILNDPQNARDKSQLLAEFGLKAREVKDSYRSLDMLAQDDKRSLVMRAKEEYRRMPDSERQELLDILQSGALPIPRDLRDSMLAEFGRVASAQNGDDRRRE
ncbi:MAG TPA: hypothetical protein VGO84_02210 [Burkholderiales bacterium]|jgi:hypothetical protein|nr:hypothetical protein [Burkholderiales bacterium]